MSENVLRFCDYEKRSRRSDAGSPRDPADCDCVVIVLPASGTLGLKSRGYTMGPVVKVATQHDLLEEIRRERPTPILAM